MFATMKKGANKMGRNRKTFSKVFKQEVAIETLRDQKTVNEIASDHGISAGMVVSNCKKQFVEGGFTKDVK